MPSPSKPPENPLKPVAFALVLERLRLTVPVSVIVALLGGIGLLLRTEPARAPAPTHVPEAPPTVAVDLRPAIFSTLAMTAPGALPEPLPEQRHPPCDPDLERELKGACWVPVAVERCPRGKAFLHDTGPGADGKCYARAMQAARTPTSGEPRNASVAE